MELVCPCNTYTACGPPRQSRWCPKPFLGAVSKIRDHRAAGLRDRLERGLSRGFYVSAVTKGSAESSKSEETLPSWAQPDADEPPPWARDEGQGNGSQESFKIPFFVYLLASAVTAIAAIGSVFEYVNQRPAFGVLNSDSVFYAPLLGFFAFTGIPTSAFLWFKSIQIANKEAEEQDRRDGYF